MNKKNNFKNSGNWEKRCKNTSLEKKSKNSKNYQKKRYKKKKNTVQNLKMNLDEDPKDKKVDEVEEVIEFNGSWVLWSHDLYNNNWELDSYEKIFEFKTIGDFWRLYNNFNAFGGLNKKNYFLMRKDIKPIWEDEKNRNGGTCSIKIPVSRSFEMWTELSMYVVGESFYESETRMADITGISICPKSIWSIIKIWNSDSDNDTSKDLPENFKNKYNKCSIKFKKNIAEY